MERPQQQLPDAFRCPISLDLMSDPVILPSGHTFDRPSIQRWLDSGHRSCPLTNLPLPPNPSLIPNRALRHLISSHRRSSPPASAAAAHDPHALAASLSAVHRLDAATLSAVLHLTKRDPAFRRILADSGASSRLLASSADPDLQDHSLRLLLHISLDGDDARVGLVAEGAVDRLAVALRSPVAALAATLLTSLAVVDANKCTIGAHRDAIPGLAALVRDGNPRERREAATALYELCKFGNNRGVAVRCGAVPALVEFAAGGSGRAVEVLGLLAKCREGREEMRRVKNIVRVLAGVLKEGSGRGVEHALAALCLVCGDDGEMVAETRREGVYAMCLGFVDDGNEKVSRNAVTLARLLERESWEA